MKTLKIHCCSEYWGNQTTDRNAEMLAIKMRNCVEAAGFKYVTTLFAGTMDACEFFQIGACENGMELGEEVNWFDRWCSHGFRGMTAWLRKQL